MVATDRIGFLVALAIFSIAAATIVGAWIFEALGYAPCELCLAQRWPYYIGIPLAGATVLLAARGSARLLPSMFVLLIVVFAASALFGAYHAGVEWGFWPGPKACSGRLDQTSPVEDFLTQLQNVRVVRCDAPALHILGLSLAGWNALVSLGLVALAGKRLSSMKK